MTRLAGRVGSVRTLAVGLLASATTWAALTSWQGLVTYPSAYLWQVGGLGVALAVAGAVLEHRLPPWAVEVVEVALALAAVSWSATGHVLPVHLHAAYDVLREAVRAAQTHAAPLDHRTADQTPILLLGGAIALLLVHALAVHLRRPPLAGLALLAVLALQAGLTGGGASLWAFAGTSAGFLALLALDARDRQHHWGRAAAEPGGSIPAAVRRAAPVGVGAIMLAVLGALVLPLPHDGLLDQLLDGGAHVTIHRPLVDMRQKLRRQDHTPLLLVTTGDPDRGYLRIAVLDRFTGTVWSSGDRDVSDHLDDLGDGRVPPPPGVAAEVPRRSYLWHVDGLPAFDSTWLPTAFPVSRIEAPGDWRYDPVVTDVVAADGTELAGTSYSMTEQRLDLGDDGRFFGDAPEDAVPAEDTQVLAVPTTVRDLAVQVTKGARSDYQRALMIQSYLRDSGLFTYSLQPHGSGTLADFLSPSGRVGYCEQFASAMAAMARIVGIPARVAVGFLRAQDLGRGQYLYTSDDLHAWPELYFQGAGWARFEPTPSVRAPHVPAYAHQQVRRHSGSPNTAPTGGPSARPSGGPRPPSPNRALQRPDVAEHPVRARHAEHGSLAPLAGAVVLLALLACGPFVVRRRQRARRLAGDAETLWTEVRATTVDLRRTWPAGASPRQAAERIADGLDPAAGQRAEAALDDLVGAVEQLRYGSSARAAAVATRTDLRPRAEAVVDALRNGAGSRARRRADWLPRSLWRR